MFITSVLCKKVKSKYVLVLLESVASGHKYVVRRARADDKMEEERFDPYVNTTVLYREIRKIKSI
ncbi:mitochondrial ribosomal protein L33 [Lasioglossum baleicum]|uniref:mitochondrial ribosomal protein L33 n=1 Tax=Lasioglossum baleicum TaxID=434251 RepID=UPI003FCD36A8